MNDILLHFHVPRYRSGFSLQSGLSAQGELAGEPVSALLNPCKHQESLGSSLPGGKSCTFCGCPEELEQLAILETFKSEQLLLIYSSKARHSGSSATDKM